LIIEKKKTGFGIVRIFLLFSQNFLKSLLFLDFFLIFSEKMFLKENKMKQNEKDFLLKFLKTIRKTSILLRNT